MKFEDYATDFLQAFIQFWRYIYKVGSTQELNYNVLTLIYNYIQSFYVHINKVKSQGNWKLHNELTLMLTSTGFYVHIYKWEPDNHPRYLQCYLQVFTSRMYICKVMYIRNLDYL